MKEVTVYLKNRVVRIHDDDTSDLSEYTKKMLDIMKSQKIMILETVHKNIIVRPSQVDCIEIIENDVITDGE